MLSHIAAAYLTAGVEGRRYGTAHPSLVPYQSFATKDDLYLTIGAGNNLHFIQLCDLMGLSELPNKSKFVDNAARVQNREEIIEILSTRFSEKNRSDWMDIFAERAKFPWGPVNSISGHCM